MLVESKAQDHFGKGAGVAGREEEGRLAGDDHILGTLGALRGNRTWAYCFGGLREIVLCYWFPFKTTQKGGTLKQGRPK